MWRSTTAALASVIVMAFAGQTPQGPDFSGHWTLVSATTSHARGTRASTGTGEERATTSNTASGAPFNCGRACTIMQRGLTLTIADALLASETKPAPAVTLRLNGQEASVVDSFNPGREIPVTATGKGRTLEIVSSTDTHTIRQNISLDGGQLVVVTSDSRDDGAQFRLRYKKQQ